MKKIILIITLLIIVTNINSFAQFNYKGSLFGDVKARDIDDAITIIIIEDTRAQSGANTSLDKSADLTTGMGGALDQYLSGSASANINTGNDFRANASSSTNEIIQTKLSARVIDIEATGNLIIKGRRTTKINGEEQIVTIEGTVRQVDLSPYNTVYSYHIMDMKLTIEGNGNLTETQEPGLITKFLRVLF